MERVEPNTVLYETLDGTHHRLNFDFAMLLPPFGGVPLKAFDAAGHGGVDFSGIIQHVRSLAGK